MTKRDYELFANEINQSQRSNNKFMIEYAVELCKRVFAQDNPLFQPDKFERACYEGKHIRKAISGKV